MRRQPQNTTEIIQVNDDDDVEGIVVMEVKDNRKYSFRSNLEVRVNVILVVRL